jgi:hypothetical protein
MGDALRLSVPHLNRTLAKLRCQVAVYSYDTCPIKNRVRII